MPREVQSYVPLLFCATIILKAGYVNSSSDNCLELIKTDIDDIENYLSKLNVTDVPTVKMMIAGFKCPISALPFGALKSDWYRLTLLREAQPDGSIIKHKLLRLMRILIIAYYQMEESFDVPSSDAPTGRKSPVNEATTIAATDDTNKPHCSNNNYSRTTILSNNMDYLSHKVQSSLTTPLSTENKYSKTKLNSTRNESMILKNFTRSYETTSVIPIYASNQSGKSPTNFSAVTVRHYSGGVKNVTFKQLNNCLKQSLKDTVRRKANRTYNKVFETVKNKATYAERVIRDANEISDHEKNCTRTPPPMNEFWRYVMLPTELTTVVNYRMRGLNGFGTSARKSQKRPKWNNDIYVSFRRFYGVDKNEEAAKKNAGNKTDISIERPRKK